MDAPGGSLVWSDTSEVSVGDLFAGALLPGLVLVALYMLYLLGVGWLRPQAAPASASEACAKPSRPSAISIMYWLMTWLA